jgi:hypothetical protein
VKLISVTAPDRGKATAKVVAVRADGTAGQLRSETIAEPETLLPYSMVLRQDSTLPRLDDDHRSQDFTELDEYAFSYGTSPLR